MEANGIGSGDPYVQGSDGIYRKDGYELEIEANPSGDPAYTYEFTYPSSQQTSGFLLN